MIDLTKSQIVDPSIEVEVRGNNNQNWQKELLTTIDTRLDEPFIAGECFWIQCRLIKKRYMTVPEVQEFICEEFRAGKNIMVRAKGLDVSGWRFGLYRHIEDIQDWEYCYLKNGEYSEPMEFLIEGEEG